MKITIDYLGCKLNQAECEEWRIAFSKIGYFSVTLSDNPDIFILNTCSVTSMADSKCRQKVRFVRKTNPECLIIAVGCSDKDSLHSCGADYSFDNSVKDDFVGYLLQNKIIKPSEEVLDNKVKLRSMVAIQSGCPHYCTYCIVPYTRGLSKSKSADTVIEIINDRVANGYSEVVLTGTEIGLYHFENYNLKKLIQKILSETSVKRLRLSSLQIFEIDEELLEIFQNNERLCRHFHISAQSGSDTVLKEMNRHYTKALYLEKIALIRKMLPDATITTDIIVGFPGETEDDFNNSIDLVEKAKFLKTHTFVFSPRKGTKAYSYLNQIKSCIQKERSLKLRLIADNTAKMVINSYIGKNAEVLIEQKEENNFYSGYSKEYIRVYIQSSANIIGEIVNVRLIDFYNDGLVGTII